MEKLFGQIAITSASGIFIFLFGAWDIAFQVLCVFMVLDYLTGVMSAFVNRKLSSKQGINGIFKKLAILCTIIVAVMLDRVLDTDMLRLATIFCLIGNEGISLLENLTTLGAPIPIQIVDSLSQLRGKGDNDTRSQK